MKNNGFIRLMLLPAIACLFLTACEILVRPTSADGIATYNAQLTQIYLQALNILSVVCLAIGGYVKSTRDHKSLEERTKEAAETLAAASAARNDKLLAEAADIKKKLERAPARATDNGVQEVKIVGEVSLKDTAG